MPRPRIPRAGVEYALDPRNHLERSSSGTTVTASRRARPTGTRRWPAGVRRSGAPSGTAKESGPRPTPRSVRSTVRSTPPCARRAWSRTAPVRAVAPPAPRVPTVEQRAPQAPRSVDEALLAADERVAPWSVVSPRWNGRGVGRAPCRTCRGPARRRAHPRPPARPRRRARVAASACGRPSRASEQVEELAADADARVRAAYDQAQPRSRTRTRPAAAHVAEARAADAEARADAAERLLAAAAAASEASFRHRAVAGATPWRRAREAASGVGGDGRGACGRGSRGCGRAPCARARDAGLRDHAS